MLKTKRFFTPLIALAMVICSIVSLFSMSVPVSAATNSYGIQTRTITVHTKANYWIPGSSSITISQSKGVCTKTNIFTKKEKASKQYGEWDIVAKATDGSHTVSKSLTGGSVKLKLKPNKTYKVTISWDSNAQFFTEINKGNYTSYPTWRVKSAYKVSNYY